MRDEQFDEDLRRLRVVLWYSIHMVPELWNNNKMELRRVLKEYEELSEEDKAEVELMMNLEEL